MYPQITSVGTADIAVQLPASAEPGALIWAVYAVGETEPFRYGLCLVTQANGFAVQVRVSGLQAGRCYRYELSQDGRIVAAGMLGAGRQQAAA